MRSPVPGIALLVALAACSRTSLPRLPDVDTASFLPSIRLEIDRKFAAVRAAPTDATENGQLGMLLHAHDRMEAALVCYRRAALLDPKDYRWTYLSGVAYAALSRNPEAVEQFQKVLAARPDDVPAQLRLADALLASGDATAARGAYQKVIEQRPGDPIGYYGAGQAYAMAGDPARAAGRYQQACERFPTYAAAHYALGLAYRQLGRPEDARSHLAAYEQSRNATPPREDPLMAEVHSLSGGVLPLLAKAKSAAAAGRFRDAVELHKQALELDPKQEQAHINLISLYGQLRQFDQAEAEYRAAVALNPSRDEAHYNYAVLLTAQDRLDEAAAAYRKALALNPGHAEANNNLGFLLARQRKFDEALLHANKALESKPDYPQAHYNAAMILLQRGKADEAIAHLRAAIHDNDPNAARYRQALAEAEKVRTRI
jgi:protein O-GlcNAc transferase